jgi:integrase
MRKLPPSLPSYGSERRRQRSLALEVCILTAARTGEILGMRWSEINLDKKIWAVPASQPDEGGS